MFSRPKGWSYLSETWMSWSITMNCQHQELCVGGVCCSGESDVHLKSESCTLHIPPAITKQKHNFLVSDVCTIRSIHRFIAVGWGNGHWTPRQCLKSGQNSTTTDKPLGPPLPFKYKIYGPLLLVSKIIFTTCLLHTLSFPKHLALP